MTLRPHIEQALQGIRARQQALYQALEPLRRVLRAFPDDAQFVQQYLADRGWYLPGGELPIAAFSQLRELSRQGKDDEIESLVQGFARSQIARVLQRVEQDHPRRRAIVVDALEAHRTGEYTLSIPALLAQADGITYDFLGVSVFEKEKGRPKTEQALQTVLGKHTLFGTVLPLGQISEVLLNPLRGPSSVIANTADVRNRQKREPAYGPLNRHAVLHGLDVDYATDANSLRAILLVDYLLEVGRTLREHSEWVEEIRRTTDEMLSAGDSPGETVGEDAG